MRLSLMTAVLSATLLAVSAGCGGGGVAEQTIQVSATNDPLHEPRMLLQKYADGQQLGSEVTSFEYMVNKVKEVDPARAEVLRAGLEDLQQAAPAARKAKAKALLDQIAPSQGRPAEPAEEPAE